MLLLPHDVICASILPLVDVSDLQALDTAFTNKYLRPQLRTLWKSYQYMPRQDESTPVSTLEWLHDAGIAIMGIKAIFINEDISRFVSSDLKKLSCETYNSKINSVVSLLPDGALSLEELELFCMGEICSTKVSCDRGIISLMQRCGNNLHTICLFDCNLTDAGIIRGLCKYCPNIRHITICGCHALTDASMNAIANTYPHLQTIDFVQCFFSKSAIFRLADSCRELRNVGIGYSAKSNDVLTALWDANPNITKIYISLFDTASNEMILTIAHHCSRLQHLELTHCLSITDTAVITVAEHCLQLTSLNIGSCDKISDASLNALGQYCRGLKSIDISDIDNISDVGISALAAGCPLLQIFIAWNTRITDTGVIALACGCRDLRKIDVSYCQSIGFGAISAVSENCPLISELILCQCSVDSACLHAIAQHCHNLTHLNISQSLLQHVSVVPSLESITTSCRLLHTLCFRGSYNDHSNLPCDLKKNPRLKRIEKHDEFML